VKTPKTVLTAFVGTAVATTLMAAPSQAAPTSSTAAASTTSVKMAAAKKAAIKKAAAKKAAVAKKSAVAKKKRIATKKLRARKRAVKALRIAKTKRGRMYRWGAAGPNNFDGSGLTSWAYRKAGKSIPRTSRAQAAAAKRTKSPKKGDLVFFHRGGRVYHVGFYAGKGKVFHAPRTGRPVRAEKIWTRAVFYGKVA
jgi:cell wall-associated NlpC family hydrolase